MRLFEIIDFEPKQSNRTSHDYERVLDRGQGKWIGSGARSEVYDLNSKKRFNQVTKIGQGKDKDGIYVDDILNDGYLAYIKTVYDFEKNGGNNSYFPKVYDLNITKDNKSRISYRANIEKLRKFYDINSKTILSRFKEMFSIPPDFEEEDFGMFKILHSCLLFGEMTGIRDSALKEAMELIYNLISEKDFKPDIHSANVMWRNVGTNDNLHLVIIDPID